MAALIPLRNRRGVCAEAVVDDADFSWLAEWRWHLTHGYAVRSRSSRKVAMHRQIMGVSDLRGHAVEVDHVNRDPLDNRRANLRLVSPLLQQHNRGPNQGSSSQFKGVTWNRRVGKWQAQLGFAGHAIYLGLFANEIEAATAVEARRAEELLRLS